VFLAGDRVYKVKKAVDLGFADYSTLELRKRYCDEEVRLNKRLARDAYLGVVPITRDAEGSLGFGGTGEAVEYAVEMRRLPANRMLDHLLAEGEIDNEQMEALASLLARFHEQAETGLGVDEYGEPDAVAFNVRENFEQTAVFAAPPGTSADAGARTLSPALHEFLRDAAERFLATEGELLRRRVLEARIRDGHGDLHAGNICLTGEGIVVYDCVEFAPRFRCGDVACDLAFLAMDLDYRRFRAFSGYLVRRYAEHARDAELQRLLGFYKSYRAIVRAKVASFAAVDEGLAPEQREERRLEAFRYFHLAASYELPPVLVLTCGLPASGKTTAARHLAAPFEAVTLRSDTRRKRLAGVARTRRVGETYGAGIYTAEMTDRTYRSLLADAEAALRNERSVVVDAAFSRAEQRRGFLELAGSLAAPFVVVEATAPEEVVRERMASRSGDRREVSDADLGVYVRMRETFEPLDELPDSLRLRAGPGEPGEELTSRAIDRLIAQLR
jgi:aminoglycoside phosphotransferase family enzyme/predicted kinase